MAISCHEPHGFAPGTSRVHHVASNTRPWYVTWSPALYVAPGDHGGGPGGGASLTVTGTRTVVPDGLAVSTMTLGPVTSSGTVIVTVAAPSVTGTSANVAAEPSHSIDSVVFCGLPREVRSSPATSNVRVSPWSTSWPAPSTTTARRAKLGDSGLLASM